MSDDIIKKIAMGLMVPIFISVVGWAVWITKQAFSAQQNEVIIQEHKENYNRTRIIIQQELDSIQNMVQDGFKSLNEKIDKNTQENNKILLDLQKQIGYLYSNKEN